MTLAKGENLQQILDDTRDQNKILLDYKYGFWRETELFGRSLYIKYYKKDAIKGEDK